MHRPAFLPQAWLAWLFSLAWHTDLLPLQKSSNSSKMLTTQPWVPQDVRKSTSDPFWASRIGDSVLPGTQWTPIHQLAHPPTLHILSQAFSRANHPPEKWQVQFLGRCSHSLREATRLERLGLFWGTGGGGVGIGEGVVNPVNSPLYPTFA